MQQIAKKHRIARAVLMHPQCQPKQLCTENGGIRGRAVTTWVSAWGKWRLSASQTTRCPSSPSEPPFRGIMVVLPATFTTQQSLQCLILFPGYHLASHQLKL